MYADTLSFDWATLGITSPALTPVSPAVTSTTKELPGIEGWSLEEMFSEMSEGTSSGGEEATLVVPQMPSVVPAPPHRPDQAVYKPAPAPSSHPLQASPKGPKAYLEEEILEVFSPEELRDADRGQWSTLKAVRSGSLSPAARKHLSVTRRKYCGRRYANKQRSGRISAANQLAIQVTALTSENQKLRLRIELLERLSTTNRLELAANGRNGILARPGGQLGKRKKVGFGAASTRRFAIADGNTLKPVRRTRRSSLSSNPTAMS